MGRNRVAAFAALLMCLILPTGLPAQGRGKELPFPVEKTTILRTEKVTYVVEGRRTIPEGVEITCLRDVYVVGRGKDAILEVKGSLKVHGVGAREVIFENVSIELAPEFNSVHIDMAIFRKGARLSSPPKKPVSGKRFFLEMVDFEDDATLELEVENCPITLRSTCSDRPVRIAAFTPPGRQGNRVKLIVLGCTERSEHPGLDGGLIVENVYDATIRINRMAGPLSAFRDCGTLIFDGNKVKSDTLEFRQSGAGDFRKSKFTKCDIYSSKVIAFSAVSKMKTLDRIFMDRCWFKGIRDPKQVRAKVLSDGEKGGRNVARILLGKIGKRPLELAGAWDR